MNLIEIYFNNKQKEDVSVGKAILDYAIGFLNFGSASKKGFIVGAIFSQIIYYLVYFTLQDYNIYSYPGLMKFCIFVTWSIVWLNIMLCFRKFRGIGLAWYLSLIFVVVLVTIQLLVNPYVFGICQIILLFINSDIIGNKHKQVLSDN